MAGIVGHGQRGVAAFAIAAFAMAAVARSAAAQTRRGSVAGMVSDSAGRGIVGAQLQVAGTDIRASSDAGGRYFLPGVWPDDVTVVVRRLGFQPESLSTRVQPGEQTTANFELRMLAVTLAASVTEDREHGRMSAFYRRKSNGVGAFITRDQIERRHPGKLSEMLRNVAGVAVAQPLFGKPERVRIDRSIASNARGACTIQLYLDGLPYPHGHVDDFPPETIEALEVYRSTAEIPADFRTRDASCGVIVIWSRDPAAAARRP